MNGGSSPPEVRMRGVRLLDKVLPMAKPRFDLLQSFGNRYRVVFSIVPADYYFVCKWFSDIVDFYSTLRTAFRLFHFRRITAYTNIMYLTKSPHAQTKYGTHVGVRLLLIEGFVDTGDHVIFLSFVRQLMNNFTIREFSSFCLRGSV